MQKAVLYLSYVAKAAGFVASLNAVPFISPGAGVVMVLGASLLKDTANRLTELLGQNASVQASQ